MSGYLSGILLSSPVTSLDLTNDGNEDWIAFEAPTTIDSPYVIRKASGNFRIDISAINFTPDQLSVGHINHWSDGAIPYKTDGQFLAAVSSSSASRSLFPSSCSLVVPANTALKTLKIYHTVTIYDGVNFIATLGDSSANLVNIGSSPPNGNIACVEFQYRAASNGQSLTIEIVGGGPNGGQTTVSSITLSTESEIIDPGLSAPSIMGYGAMGGFNGLNPGIVIEVR